ncbi:MAG: CDP-alcohol phosphatidyltransferase family protein [Candidatus Zixiibacteriota bacterium]
MWSDITKIPNLISIGRLLLLIPTGYFIAQPGNEAKIYALCFLTIAALSDFLDGFLARKLKQQTQLGLLLDPLSDKILAGVLAILLILYRDFPLWLAAVIIGRDIVISLGGLIVKNKIHKVPASTLSGKYCFAAIAILLISYLIEFPFGIWFFTFWTLFYSAASLIVYSRILYRISADKPIPVFRDRPLYKAGRLALCWSVSGVYVFQLLKFIHWI